MWWITDFVTCDIPRNIISAGNIEISDGRKLKICVSKILL